MAERAVFPPKVLYSKWLLSLFALFYVAGHFFRLIPMPGFTNHISIVELLFYLFCIPVYLSSNRKSFFLITAFLLSSSYGALLNGFDLNCTLYALKLCASIMGGLVLGEVADERYFLRLFVGVLILGAAIFFLFPKASLFFNLLQGYGIQFEGDPHQRRFISPFFDPNFYAAIACIPLILSYHLGRKWLFFLFLLSIFLTFSRSGIATALLLLVPMLFSIKRVHRSVLICMPLVLGLCAFVYSSEFLTLFERTFAIDQDPSAHARLVTFEAGWELFLNHPFFGVGAHYSFLLLEGLKLDSSLLMALIDFGLIPILVFLTWIGLKAYKHANSPLFSWLLFYTIVCIGFTSHFNNLLFYQYWLIPMIALLKYESRICS